MSSRRGSVLGGFLAGLAGGLLLVGVTILCASSAQGACASHAACNGTGDNACVIDSQLKCNGGCQTTEACNTCACVVDGPVCQCK